MGREETEVAVSFEVQCGEEGRSFSLVVESDEEMTYLEFLDAIRTFLETEEADPAAGGH